MMSPNNEKLFRESTETRARSPLAGNARFICPVCKLDKPLLGRKRRAKGGFRCADCAAKLELKRGTVIDLKYNLTAL